ncbi:murein biosynthesis integral membrane protein MurJ [Nocardia harenae]|uniref:murein biosynthesis integral membrane protein MurJ n=1 Tax=Nocardia harenae TaxID=358707 RepID=UPI000A034326|nr:murein biosynthesis integral membrane protein MurJ [Nocardia harenae]
MPQRPPAQRGEPISPAPGDRPAPHKPAAPPRAEAAPPTSHRGTEAPPQPPRGTQAPRDARPLSHGEPIPGEPRRAVPPRRPGAQPASGGMPRQPAHPGRQRYPAEPSRDRKHAHEAPSQRPAPQRIPASEPKHARPAEPATSRYAQSAGAATALAPEPERPESRESANARLLRDSGSIAIATLISRITGFGKQLLLLAVLGPAVASSFVSANLIPNMIAELVLGAVLTAIVVPTLIRAEQEDDDHGAAFVRRLVTAAFTVLAVAALLATAAAPILATHVFVSSDGKVNTELTTALTFLLVPAILFYGMSALLTAILNTRQAFRPGAWAPVLNNVVVLIMLGAYALTPGEISLNPVTMGDAKLLVLGLGVTTGVFVQAASLLPAIRRHGIDLRPLWGIDARLKQFGRMGIAIILYVLISQVGLIVANNISSHADEAGPAIYSNAWLLLQLPYGVLGVTLLTAIMPRLSRNAAADDTPAVVDDLSVATRLTMIALVPVVIFLTLAGPQVGEALFGYARFAEDAERLGQAVSWSAFALIPYSMVLIHLRVFYAREQAWTPTWIVLGITAVKIIFSALAPVLSSDSSHVVIMLGAANGLGYTAGAFIGGYLLHRSLGDLRMANVGRTVSRVVLAAIAGGAVMLIVDRVLGLGRLSESFGGPGSLIRVAILAVVMFGVAFGLMRLAGIPEIVAITVAVSRRLGITPPAPDLDLDSPAAEEATRVLQRRDQYEYPRFDPYGDSTQTMVLPVIRPDAVGRTGSGHFPYPVRQRSTSGDDETSTYPAEGGPRVSDDAVGGVPADDSPGNRPAGLSTEHRPAEQPLQPEQGGRVPPRASGAPVPPPGAPQPGPVPPDAQATVRIGPGDLPPEAAVPPGAGPDTGSAHAHPPRDPLYDTGMLPIPPVGGEQGPGRRIPRGPKLIPGASVAGGRYRLLADCGGSRGLKFWQALDIKLDREVALTFVDADQKSGDNSGQDGPQAILSRTLRLGRINSPGLARVLDVVRGSSGGIVVAEWTPGRSLREMAETVPSPIGAARAIRVLASAAELAHRGGGALSIDHPDRVRISASGDAVLAFPGTLSDADAQGDVRGLGAMLYALILARWPIRSGGLSGQAATVGGLRLADFGQDGTPVEPRQVRPEVPFEISAVAVRSLESNKGVRTAATVQHVLEQASVVDQKTDFIPVLRLGQRQQPPVEESLADPELLAAERERSQRMLWIMVGLGILAALVVGIVIWWMVSLFAGGEPSEPLDQSNNIGLTSETTAPPAAPIGPAEPAANTGVAPVPATAVGVFSPEGTPDGTGNADAVIDRDPASTWRTDQYFQQFPALKKGVGLLATLPTPARLSSVAIESPSAGSTVEIRTSPTESPTLDQTQLIGSARLANGVTDIPVRTDQAARYVLVWITGLSSDGGRFQTTIGELRFNATP